MVTVYDVKPSKLINAVKKKLKQMQELEPPSWSKFAKTGMHKENPPSQEDFWHVRAASIMRTLYVHGAKGVERLRRKYGGRKDRGPKEEKVYKGSGKIIRVILQQLEEAGLAEKVMKKGNKGRQLTPEGVKLLDNTAYEITEGGGG